MNPFNLHMVRHAQAGINPQAAAHYAHLFGLLGGGGLAAPPNIQGGSPQPAPATQPIQRTPVAGAPPPPQPYPNTGVVPPGYDPTAPWGPGACLPQNWWMQYYGIAPYDPRQLAFDAQAAGEQDASRQTPIPFTTTAPAIVPAGGAFIITTTPTVPVCGGRFIFSRQMAQDFAFSSFTVAQKELFAGAGLIPADSFAADAVQQPMIEIPMCVPGQPMVLQGVNISANPRQLIGVLWAKKLPFANRMCPG